MLWAEFIHTFSQTGTGDSEITVFQSNILILGESDIADEVEELYGCLNSEYTAQ